MLYIGILASCHNSPVFNHPHLPTHCVFRVTLGESVIIPLNIGPTCQPVPQSRPMHSATTAGTPFSLPSSQLTAADGEQRTDSGKSFRLHSCVDCPGSLAATALAACTGPAVVLLKNYFKIIYLIYFDSSQIFSFFQNQLH